VIGGEDEPHVAFVDQLVEVVEEERLAAFGGHGELEPIPALGDRLAARGGEAVADRLEQRREGGRGRLDRDVGRVLAEGCSSSVVTSIARRDIDLGGDLAADRERHRLQHREDLRRECVQVVINRVKHHAERRESDGRGAVTETPARNA